MARLALHLHHFIPPGYDDMDEIIENKNKVKGMWENLKPIDLSKIQTVQFPDDQYFHDIYEKKQIILHHTMGASAESDIQSWEDDPAVVATCIIIDRAGTPWQLFSSKYWAYHLGTGGDHSLDKHSIGIEIDNWGWLIPGDGTVKQFNGKSVQTVMGKYYTYYGNPVTVPMQYYENGFRGYNYYEKYYDQQLQTLGELILYWKMKYNIPLTYNPDIWDVSPKALAGTPGIWTHCSYLPAPKKYDCHPQPNLISLLQELDGIN